MKISKGVQYLLYSTIFFTVMQALIKAMPQYTSFEHVFFRCITGLILCMIILKKDNISFIGKKPKMLLYRGIIGSVSMFSFFYILSKIPFGTASAFKYMSPIFATIFAIFLLGEKIRIAQWFYFAMCFLGIILLNGFDIRIELFDTAIGLLCAVSGGLLIIVIKKIGDDDHPLVILQYFMLIATLISFFIIIKNWRCPESSDLFQLLSIGIIGFFAQYFFTKSIQQPDEVGSITILRYLEVFLALVMGYFWFDESYTWQSFFAIILILLGILLSFYDTIKFKNSIKFENE